MRAIVIRHRRSRIIPLRTGWRRRRRASGVFASHFIALPSKDAAARAHGPAVEWGDMLSISGRRQTAKREPATLTKQIDRVFDLCVTRPMTACKLLLRDFRNHQGRPWFWSPWRRAHTASPGVLQPERSLDGIICWRVAVVGSIFCSNDACCRRSAMMIEQILVRAGEKSQT